MGFYVGAHRTLMKMGKWRFGIGYRAKGATGAILVFLFAILNLMWYMILGCIWLTCVLFYQSKGLPNCVSEKMLKVIKIKSNKKTTRPGGLF